MVCAEGECCDVDSVGACVDRGEVVRCGGGGSGGCLRCEGRRVTAGWTGQNRTVPASRATHETSDRAATCILPACALAILSVDVARVLPVIIVFAPSSPPHHLNHPLLLFYLPRSRDAPGAPRPACLQLARCCPPLPYVYPPDLPPPPTDSNHDDPRTGPLLPPVSPAHGGRRPTLTLPTDTSKPHRTGVTPASLTRVQHRPPGHARP